MSSQNNTQDNTTLAVNIDHFATLRNARNDVHYCDILEAANLCLKNGASFITIHLREDRRHIKDADVQTLVQHNIPICLEMAATDEMLQIALQHKPKFCCLVPEKRQELTTEGGLNVEANKDKLIKIAARLKEVGTSVSFFINADLKSVDLAKEYGASGVEINTGSYSIAHDKETHNPSISTNHTHNKTNNSHPNTNTESSNKTNNAPLGINANTALHNATTETHSTDTNSNITNTNANSNLTATNAETHSTNITNTNAKNPDLTNAHNTNPHSVELHDTSPATNTNIANAHSHNQAHQTTSAIECQKIEETAQYAIKNNLFVHAGHGLTYDNIPPIKAIAQKGLISNFSIGHFLVTKSLFIGIESAVSKMHQIITTP